jgi:hypothetical protein
MDEGDDVSDSEWDAELSEWRMFVHLELDTPGRLKLFRGVAVANLSCQDMVKGMGRRLYVCPACLLSVVGSVPG